MLCDEVVIISTIVRKEHTTTPRSLTSSLPFQPIKQAFLWYVLQSPSSINVLFAEKIIDYGQSDQADERRPYPSPEEKKTRRM